MEIFYDPALLWLFLAGIPIGIFAIVFGGTMFLCLPVFQLLFPEMAMGAIVGNIKMGSILRNLSALYPLRHHIQIKPILPLIILFCAGAAIGAFSIASVSQIFILPAIIIAILVSEFSSVIAKHIPRSLFYLIVFLTGIFGGILGAGILLLIIALLRVQITEDEKLHHVRALAVFTEFLISLSAVIVFWSKDLLILKIWLIWAIGSMIGGFIGGMILHHTKKMHPKTQKIFLRLAFLFAFMVAVIKML